MDIDVTVVVAQIVNFLVLVWLLKRFLYRPIVGVIEARERAVNERIDQAKALQVEAQQEIDTYQHRLAELEKSRDEVLQEARDEAERLRQRLTQQALDEVEDTRHKALSQWRAERGRIEREVQEGLLHHVGQVTSKLLQDMAGRSLQDGLIDAFEREWAQAEMVLHSKPVTVRLSFEPTPAQKSRLRHVLRSDRDDGAGHDSQDIQFVHDENLLFGIEVDVGSDTMIYSAETYLEELIAEAVKQVNGLNDALNDAETSGAVS